MRLSGLRSGERIETLQLAANPRAGQVSPGSGPESGLKHGNSGGRRVTLEYSGLRSGERIETSPWLSTHETRRAPALSGLRSGERIETCFFPSSLTPEPCERVSPGSGPESGLKLCFDRYLEP